MHMYFYRHLVMYTPHVQFICTPHQHSHSHYQPRSNLSTTHDMRDDAAAAAEIKLLTTNASLPKQNAAYPVGVALPLECDMLYGASTFFALQIRHARFRTLPSACTTSGANSMPNICWMA